MKKIFPILALLAVLCSSCKKDNWLDWKTQNELYLEQLVKSDTTGMYQKTASGLVYRIEYPGIPTDVRPSGASTVYVDYTGWLINGYQFDQATYSSLAVSQVVAGFAEGIKKIRNQGDIWLYIPWDLAYGEEGTGTEGGSGYIPPYSTLIFQIHLCAVTN